MKEDTRRVSATYKRIEHVGDDPKMLATKLEEMDPEPTATAAAIALFMGLRVGEICALKWSDVDFKANTLDVRASIGIANGGAYEKPPKNASSVRKLPIPEALVAFLQRRRVAMLEQLADAGVNPSVTGSGRGFGDLYVVGSVDGRFTHPTVISREWRTIASVLHLVGSKGKPVTFHDLRHTFATVAVKSGIDVKSIAAYMGHSSAKMTLDTYASDDPAAKTAAAEKMNDALR